MNQLLAVGYPPLFINSFIHLRACDRDELATPLRFQIEKALVIRTELCPAVN
jgi:hypothetical protein